jgi:hypothetical protein
MNSQKAKEILVLYRPGTADAEDASFSEARRLCDRDPELRHWFDEHCAEYTALSTKFKQVLVPEGLKEQILAERKVHTAPLWRKPSFVLAAVAAVAVLLGLVSLRLSPREDVSFAGGFLPRMVSFALRGYGMDLSTSNPSQIHHYLAVVKAPSDYALSTALQKAALAGCATTSWQGAKVSMICFYSGKPLPPGRTTDLWLFVIDRGSVAGAPSSAVPSVTRVGLAMTANWTKGDKTYVLVSDRDEEFLRKYL